MHLYGSLLEDNMLVLFFENKRSMTGNSEGSSRPS